jgi:hypothetical protein
MKKHFLIYLLTVVSSFAVFTAHGEWYKGALHLHSLRSDGDGAPEVPVAWYKEHGWNFVCVTEHNQMQRGERFRNISEEKAPKPEQVAALRRQFGDAWVETVKEDGQEKLRLKTFEEMKKHFDDQNAFLLMHGEEITSIGSGPHVGAINLVEQIPARGKGDVVAAARLYHETVVAQSAEKGQPMLAILNHPNFADAVTIEEMLQLPEYCFFEVYNGHPSVNNWGHPGKGYPSTDCWWDVVLTLRISQGEKSPLLGVATDDAHDYYKWGTGEANPGRGWVMVNAPVLEVNALLKALETGEFYASTGVVLDDIRRDGAGLSFTIKGEPDVTYTTRFLGTRKGFSKESWEYNNDKGETPERASRVYDEDIGVVLSEAEGLNPAFRFVGYELYVRAVVISNTKPSNPLHDGDVEMAWVQPVVAN